jgi:hypothetical protein
MAKQAKVNKLEAEREEDSHLAAALEQATSELEAAHARVERLRERVDAAEVERINAENEAKALRVSPCFFRLCGLPLPPNPPARALLKG